MSSVKANTPIRQLVDYSEWSSDDYSILKATNSSSVETRAPMLPELFFSESVFEIRKTHRCRFCRHAMRVVLWETAESTRWAGAWEVNKVFECRNCGWWKYGYYEENEGATWSRQDEFQKEYRAIARSFDVASNYAPLRNLREEALKEKGILYEISPRRMEELVKYCFEAYFNCEVEHCGRSHDGGVDLVVIQSDSPILVQVKRRAAKGRTESIGAVRDFLGAMLIRNSRSGIFVSTASRFSTDSIKVRNQLLQRNLVDYFELFDIDRFVSLLGVAKKIRPDPPWLSIVREPACLSWPLRSDDYCVVRDSYKIRHDECKWRRSNGYSYKR